MSSDMPRIMGERLYSKMYKYHDDEWGSSVGGVIGGQGSVKTACCLDIAQKKMKYQPSEKIFWHETIGSPCQFLKIIDYPYKIFIENDLNLEFVDITNNKIIYPDVVFFSDIEELYTKSKYETLNVVFFDDKKSWICYNNKQKTDKVGLLEFLMTDTKAGNDWQTIIVDELQTLFPEDCDNQTEDKWWNWTHDAALKIMECRKSRVGFVGNYHNPNAIYHQIINKFMFHLWGFGSRPRQTRVNQNCVDQLKLGEFWIDHQGTLFGKIKIDTVFNPPSINWVVRYK